MNINNKKELIEKWSLHVTRKSHAHASCAQKSRSNKKLIGVPSVAFSAIVGTAVFSEIQDSDEISKYIIIVLVLTSAILTSLQTFFNFGEVEQVHNLANKKYSQVRRKLDRALSSIEDLTDKEITVIENMMNEASEVEPSIPDKVWNIIVEKIN